MILLKTPPSSVMLASVFASASNKPNATQAFQVLPGPKVIGTESVFAAVRAVSECRFTAGGDQFPL
jgi:hypothetical protein